MAKQQDPKKTAEDIEDSFANLRKTLQSIGEELGVNVNKIAEAKKEYRSLLDIARQLQNNEEEIQKLSDKQIKSLRSKSESSLRDLKATAQKLAQEKGIVDISKVNLKFRRDLTEEQFTLLSALKDNFSVESQIVSQLEEEDKLRGKINKKTGVLGGVLKGISKIPILGDIFDANEALDATKNKVRETESALAGLGAAVVNIGKQITEGILNSSNLVLGTITFLVDAFKQVDQGAEDYARSMNVTYNEALNVRGEMDKIAQSTSTTLDNSVRLQETLAFVGEQLGSNAKLNAQDVATFTELREAAGFINEELMGMTSLTLANGKFLKDNTKEFLAQAKTTSLTNGVLLNEKQLMKDIGKISAATTLTLGKNPKELAKAAATAKALGMEMSKLEDIASGLLNFESSIENELSAELLTGKEINLERARLAALNGDIATLAEEINSEIGSSADFTKMNVIQQEALAKAVGMNREELAQTLFTQEQLRGLSGEQAEDAQRLLDQRIEDVGLAQAQKELEEGGLDALKEQAGVQTEFNKAIEDLKIMLVNDLLPGFEKVTIFLRENMGLIKGMVVSFAALKASQIAYNAASFIGLGISKAQLIVAKNTAKAEGFTAAMKSLGGTPFVGIGLAIAAAIAAFATLNSVMNDGIIPPAGGSGYGKRVLYGPEGSIQLNNKDTIVAGTNLFDKADDMVSAPKGTIKMSPPSGGGSSAEVVSAINSLKQSVNALASRPINVGIDGQKVIKATTGANPNTDGDEMRKNSYKIQ
jgi:hypothetical protein